MAMYSRVIPPEIRDFISYDPESGEFRWKAPHRLHHDISGRAGCVNTHGYRQIGFNGTNYLEHRIAWYLVYGEQPKCQIDHANRVKHDNRICNLRLATGTQNRANQKSYGTLKKGVFKYRSGGEVRPFGARIYVDRKCHYLGYYPTEAEAHAAYCDAAVRFFGEFARFE